MLVLIGATPEGKKELVGFQIGVRESAQSWRELLVDIKERGLAIAPELATGDGALGFWKALEEVSPTTRHQRCTVHKTANVLNKLPTPSSPPSRQTFARSTAPDRATAETAIDVFAEKYGAKYDKAATCLIKDRDALLTFYDFPAEHWDHLRTSNPIESVFATVRHRTVRTKGALSPGHRPAHGVQARHRRRQDVAQAEGREPVAQGRPRRHIPKRRRGDQHASTERRLITPRHPNSSIAASVLWEPGRR